MEISIPAKDLIVGDIHAGRKIIRVMKRGVFVTLGFSADSRDCMILQEDDEIHVERNISKATLSIEGEVHS